MNTSKGASDVLKRTSDFLRSGLVTEQPAWYKPVAYHPPKQIQHKTIRPEKFSKLRKLSVPPRSGNLYNTRLTQSDLKLNLLKPQNLKYLEDKIRNVFYQQHPWELADPKSLIENEHTIDNKNQNWSHMRQLTKRLDGESVVQRTLYVMQNEKLNLVQAYEKAKYEYYRLKIEEETEMNVAREEHEMFGAVYDKTVVEQGFDKETEVIKKWKVRALEETQVLEARLSNLSSDLGGEEDVQAPDEDTLFNDLEDVELEEPNQ
ncbi:hypothetical protein KL942_000328 [Ogataea angusta]|uniref:37S ribosomal protein S25, mitochondrial n=1 Tax=Pichia angusta TaxID=870730 RepID=A0AAN6I8F6_PICAN|nr:uncharacterized protein KL928_001124 [Ogataea angusta]KAG7821040.1 hypothetical protein KL928_001124 [Ogataea angusta]KAG7826259.1 hypothetical protein KL909_000311 [Ogataea angusta]KAG7831994.1 hypothetical protein KL920_000329 [Ogataea angusta]KAG7836166.1 hypothetical protein KL943_001815 [Ogataea angusta]KAG7843232.1 hypothetical protein KL942_000328 [Ogataea angusta]